MEDITGITFGSGEHPWGPLINLVNFDHPITQNLPHDLTWGTNNPLCPIFHVNDSGARTLGNVVYSQGRCRPGFVIKEFPNWKSIYSAAPNLPAGVLREIARYAGVHIYNDDGDVIYATRDLLAIHTAAGGHREIRLPRLAPQVYDLFSNTMISTETDHFEIELPPASTHLYFLGDKKYLMEVK